MIYEEPKVDVIEFAEGEIVTDLIGEASGGGNTTESGSSARTYSSGWWE